MSIVVVIRSNGKSQIFKGPISSKKLDKIRVALGFQPKKRNVWSDQAVRYMVENYRRISASQIADDLSNMTGKRFTKNMIISKWNRT